MAPRLGSFRPRLELFLAKVSHRAKVRKCWASFYGKPRRVASGPVLADEIGKVLAVNANNDVTVLLA